MNSFKKAAFAALACGSMLVASIPQSAQAGWNGQQLEIRSIGSNITVEGINQRGQRSIWKSSQRSGVSYKTHNFWWKGSVKITVTAADRQKVTCTYNVPTVWRSDWYTVDCLYPTKLI